MKRYKNLIILPVMVFMFSACQSSQKHQADVAQQGDRMTLGVVQKKIHKGMGADQVAAALGSPNIVTKDKSGKESWIYDKIASEASYSHSDGGVFLILGGFSRSAGAFSSTQRTLTVIVKFSEDNVVEDFSYHSSRF